MLNVHIYPSTFKFESRIIKETASIVKLGLASRVLIISLGDSNQAVNEVIAPNINLKRVITYTGKIRKRGKLFAVINYFEFYCRLFFILIRLPIHTINCHNLMVLPVGVLLKWVKRCNIIYDPHELETERVGLSGFNKMFSKLIERFFIQFIDAIIVVSPSIADWYKAAYQLNKVNVIMNAPAYKEIHESDKLRKLLSIPDNDLIFIYQGIFMTGRSIELFVNVFKRMPMNKHLVLMGYGPLEEYVKTQSEEYKNIHYLPAVKPEEILEYTSGADIGIHTPENCCLSYYFSLPNKFFEYIMAEIPAIISNFPDMSSIIEAYGIGWTTPVKEEELSNLVESLNSEHIELKKNNIKKIKSKFSWENEETRIVEVFSFNAWR